MYKMLIVDDEPHIIEGVRRIIDWQRYQITDIHAAYTFSEAVKLALSLKPHIVLTDVRIGEEWGYELIESLTRAEQNCVFIMMSGYDDFNYVRKSLLAGARDYLLKPIDKIKLQTIIEQVIVNDLHGVIPQNTAMTEIDPILHVPLSSLSKLTNKVLLIVQSSYNENLTLKYVADMFQMNSVYIGQAFLKETHMKFSEYVLAYRMHIAYELLKTTDEKIAYIARRVGFQHLSYFYSLFRNYYDVSPSELRNMEKEEDEE